MADPLTLGLVAGGGMGFGKYLGDVAGNASDKKLNATIAKWSPWTKMQPKEARSANFFGDLVPGLLAGAAFGALNPGGILGSSAAGAGAGSAAAGGAGMLGVDTALPTGSSLLQSNPWLAGGY